MPDSAPDPQRAAAYKDLASSAGVNATSVRSRAAGVSVASNLLLTLLKLAVGVMTGSMGVISEAVHSGIDLLASGLAFVAVRAAARPADQDHAYGHGKYENLSGLAEGALIGAAGAILAWEAVGGLLSPGRPPHVDLGIGAIAASCVINLFVSQYLFRVARQQDSPALEADARHLSSDVLTGVGVLVGLALVHFTHMALFDGLTALLVSVWILRIAWKLVAAAMDTLVDHSLPPDEVEAIERILQGFEDQLVEWHALRTRRSGSQRHVDVHLVVPGEISARSAHEIAEGIECALLDRFPDAIVMTHVDVADRLSDGRIVVSE